MVALLEEEIVSINGSSHPELDIPTPPQLGDETEAIPLIGVSELSPEFGLTPKELLESLNHSNQRFFKEGSNRDRMLALTELLLPDIKREHIDKALLPIELFNLGNSHAIKAVDKESVRIWSTIYQIPQKSRDAAEKLKKWNPDCVNETPSSVSAPATTPAKRGRKPKSAETSAATPITVKAAPSDKPYKTIDDPKIEEQISRAVNNGRWTTAAKLVVKSVGDRAEEFLVSAQQIDDRYVGYLDKLISPIVKTMGLTGNKAKEKREEIKGFITQKFSEMASNESAEAA